MQLERCKSHEKQSRRQAWEPVFIGTPTEIIQWYESYSHSERVSDGFRVSDQGRVSDMQQFLFAWC